MRVRQVPLSVKSMNKGDCFILDAGRDILVYVGENAKRVEKLKAISAANQIRDQDHNGRATVRILDEFSKPADQEDFFELLGSGSPDEVAEDSDDDAIYETKDSAAITLYKVSDDGGSLQVEEIASKPLTQSMLNTEVSLTSLKKWYQFVSRVFEHRTALFWTPESESTYGWAKKQRPRKKLNRCDEHKISFQQKTIHCGLKFSE